MTSLQELLAQRAEIEDQIKKLQSESRATAIAKVKALMAEHGLTSADILGRGAAPDGAVAVRGPKTGGTVAPKFRNAATGETWSGRGLQPKWLKAALASGASIEDFAIAAS